MKLLLLPVLLLLARACSSSIEEPAPDPEAPVQTDERTYRLEGESLRIALSYVNRTDRTVFPARCGFTPPDFYLERREGERWVRAYSPACEDILIYEPVEVAPGQVYADTAEVYVWQRPDTFPRFEVEEIPGLYRMVVRIYESWEPDSPRPGYLGELLPEQATTSNPFRIIE